jgi:pimeloyl-ACP methyl ester carboxylesterase
MTPAVLLAAALAAAAPSPAQAQGDAVPAASSAAAPAPLPALHRRGGLVGEDVELKAVDGWTLKAMWSRAQTGQPTMVLLHGTGQRKEDWGPLARALTAKGIGWLAVDMRGHGESRTSPTGEVLSWKKLHAQRDANDYQDMTRDAEAGVGYLTGQGVPEESIGLVGAEVGGSVAIKYAAVHSKVPLVILLSPGLSWQEVPIVNAIRAYRNRPILMIHSDADKRSAKETPLLYEFAKLSAGPTHAALIVVAEERGTRMLRANKGLIQQIVDWIGNPVPPAPAVSTATASGVAVGTGTAAGVAVDTAAAPGAEPAPEPQPAPENAPASGGADMDSNGFPAPQAPAP